MTVDVNLLAGWIGIFIGLVSGIIPGLLFRNKEWMGGYASWERRLTRLGHISFFGLGFLNVIFFLTLDSLAIHEGTSLASILYIIGAISMPTICYASAWKPVIRHLFFIPVVSLVTGTLLTLILIWPS